MERFGLKNGIWICSFDEFKGLCTVLRESIIKISRAIVAQDKKGDKMGMLYDFLTSNEFKLQIEAIIADMYGSIKGIAGSAIQSVPLLELPAQNEIDVDV